MNAERCSSCSMNLFCPLKEITRVINTPARGGGKTVNEVFSTSEHDSNSFFIKKVIRRYRGHPCQSIGDFNRIANKVFLNMCHFIACLQWLSEHVDISEALPNA